MLQDVLDLGGEVSGKGLEKVLPGRKGQDLVDVGRDSRHRVENFSWSV